MGTAQLKKGAVTAKKISASARLSPVIYAHVQVDGTIDAAQSKGIKQSMVHLRETSAYCFSGLPFKPKNGSVSIDYAHATEGDRELAELEVSTGTAADCNSGEHIEVATSSDSHVFGQEPFYLVLYG